MEKVAHSAKKRQDVHFLPYTQYLKTLDIAIVQLVADGFTALEIADKTRLTNRSVEHRILKLRKKLNCKTVTHLVVVLLRANVIK